MRICFAARLIAIEVVLVMVQSSPGVENKTGIVCAFVRTVAAFPLPLYITIEVTKATGGAPNYRPPPRSRPDNEFGWEGLFSIRCEGGCTKSGDIGMRRL
jgi:hypothetical protein